MLRTQTRNRIELQIPCISDGHGYAVIMAADNFTDRSEHLWILGLALCAILGSFILQPSPDGGLALPIPFSGAALSLPDTCMSRRLLGMPCPGCGLTRSFVAMSRAEFSSAFALNPLGPALYLLCWLQIPYRIGEYREIGRHWRMWAMANDHLHKVTWCLIFALFFTWAARIVAF